MSTDKKKPLSIDEMLALEITKKFDKDAELAVIGSILIDPGVINAISEVLSPDDFYGNNGKRIYGKAVEMNAKNEPIDIVTLYQALKADNPERATDDKVLMVHAMEITPTAANVMSYANIVHNMAIARTAMMIGRALAADDVCADNAFDVVMQAAEELSALLQKRKDSGLVSLGDIVIKYHDSLFKPETVDSLSTGFGRLDKLLCGLSPGNFCVIAARPGVGKTSFSLNMALRMMKAGKRVALFSLEMSDEEIYQRLVSIYSSVPHTNIKQHEIAQYISEIGKSSNYLYDHGKHLYINDTAAMTVSQIKNQCLNKGYDIIIIDYLQLLDTERRYENKASEVSSISRALKVMAMTLKVPVVCMSQLNRESDKRASKRPTLSELRDSGSIEQDANQVIFLFNDDKDDEEVVTVNIAKNRSGQCGDVRMRFDKTTQRILELDRVYPEKSRDESDGYKL